MNWFRALLVTAVVCATMAVVTWLTFAVLGAPLGDAGLTFVLAASAAAIVLGATAAVASMRR